LAQYLLRPPARRTGTHYVSGALSTGLITVSFEHGIYCEVGKRHSRAWRETRLITRTELYLGRRISYGIELHDWHSTAVKDLGDLIDKRSAELSPGFDPNRRSRPPIEVYLSKIVAFDWFH
jgi:hypothetical protein